MSSLHQIDDTIPMISRRIGSWQISISQCLLPPGQLANRYDLIATDWERNTRRFRLETTYQRLLFNSGTSGALANISGAAQVLDCGVGSGSLSIALHRLLAERINCHGIDTSSEMLNTAKAGMRRAGIAARLKQANVLSIPYADASFDLVMAAHVLEHLPRPDLALKEMMRVLKPGGQLFICMTRPSLFGVLIQMRWRTWTVTETQGMDWLRACGLSDIGLCRVGLGRVAGSGSTAFWAKRPR